VFRYLLRLPDGEPADPAAFVTAVPNWSVGETFMVAGGKQFRIVGINDEIDVEGLEELYERGITGSGWSSGRNSSPLRAFCEHGPELSGIPRMRSDASERERTSSVTIVTTILDHP
jgi:hypothetical protein